MRRPLRGSFGKGSTWFKPALVQLVLAVLVSARSNAVAAGGSPLELYEEGDGAGLSGSLDSNGALDNSRDRFRRSILMPLGKRITPSLVAELGRRPRQLYSFGIGKRSISQEDMAAFLAEEAAGKEEGNGAKKSKHLMMNRPAASLIEMEKRAEDVSSPLEWQAEFGLENKRDPYAFGLGKREPYAFGLGKRNTYSFGLGKRDPYSFGLGKRDPYSFGLGKRDHYVFGLDELGPYSVGMGKRDPYSFGLGKRSTNHYQYDNEVRAN